jgi:aerobic carbon-monoxide dehydrogenase medium subunit
MIPAAFDYVRATTVAGALKALDAGGTKVIAGGQSLMPLLRFRLSRPKRLVDVGQIAALRGIRKKGGGLVIGAATTYRELLDSRAVRAYCPMLLELTESVGDVQVRNLGTMGGGLAHADPAADMPAALLVLGAALSLQSKAGKRKVPAAKFFKGPFTTAMKAKELMIEIELPALPKGAGAAYVNFEQQASGFALVGAAAVVARTNGVLSHAALAYSGLSEAPLLAVSTAALVGTRGGDAAFTKAAQAAVDAMEFVNDDIHATEAYRRHLGVVAGARALARATERAT